MKTIMMLLAVLALGGCASGVQLYESGQVTVKDREGNVTASYSKPVRIASFNSNVRAKTLTYTGPNGIKLEVEGHDDGLMFDNATVVKAWCDGAQGIIRESTTGAVKTGVGGALLGLPGAAGAAVGAFAP